MALLSRKEAPFKVEIPSPKQDRAITSKVGIVAVVGFAVGVVWPRLLGVQVGPDVPGGNAQAPGPSGVPASSAGAPKAAPQNSGSAASSAPDEDGAADGDQSPTNKETIVVGDGKVDGCKSKKGDKTDDCGKVSFDKIAKTRLGELARCPAAIGLEGKMALALTLNFEKNEVVVDGERKKSGLPSDTVRGVILCAAKELKGVELEKIPHTHLKYSMSYELTFYPPGKAPAAPDENAKPGDAPADATLGRATVTWDKALVRETPETGKVVVRLAQGTRVKLVEQQGDWFKIDSSKGKGWVYRQAIGK